MFFLLQDQLHSQIKSTLLIKMICYFWIDTLFCHIMITNDFLCVFMLYYYYMIITVPVTSVQGAGADACCAATSARFNKHTAWFLLHLTFNYVCGWAEANTQTSQNWSRLRNHKTHPLLFARNYPHPRPIRIHAMCGALAQPPGGGKKNGQDGTQEGQENS